MVGTVRAALGALAWLATAISSAGPCAAASLELNPVPAHPMSIGPEAGRLIVGFRATPENSQRQVIRVQRRTQSIEIVQAHTDAGDVDGAVLRARLSMAASRQLTPSTHVVYLQKTLYGADVDAALRRLRSDPAVAFADVDQRRYPQAVPDDPLYVATADGAGQWYLMTPGVTGDAAATDAVSAWSITTGSAGIVIADVDTGVRFDHPDLSRAGFGGRLLPGYDFTGGDLSTNGGFLGTYLIANDGDGWDPDPSDPGDWIDASDQANALFPAKSCAIADSSWHGTRVMGILGALTNNSIGIAGMTWKSYLLPVRALGKCGGYDSDIIAGMEWAAGMTVTGVPNNPYPADIVNLSLGGTGTCPASYASAVKAMTALGVLIVASAGNESGPVDAPANCAGVLGVAGLRNAGTKVGYSSLGAEVSIAAPAGNCVNLSGACLKPIDTTSNTGLTAPVDSTYTNTLNPNLGTSFSAPIVSGIAALMLSVNANLTPAQLTARLKNSALPFPQPTGIPVCPNSENDPVTGDPTGLCACPNDGSQCGAGMVNALNAVMSAERPIAAVLLPAGGGNGSASTLDASGSAAACGAGIVAYAWSATGAAIQNGTQNAAAVIVTPSGTAGAVTLVVTDSAGNTDTAVINVNAAGAFSYANPTTPSTAGTSVSACVVDRVVAPVAPTVSESFLPTSVARNVASTLTITLDNANGFDVTGSGLTVTLPGNLVVVSASGGGVAQTSYATTCSGAGASLNAVAGAVTLAGANIPAKSSCTITIAVQSALAGSYAVTIAAGDLQTGPAGANAAPSTANLAVSAPSSGGGGELDWWDTLFVVGVLLAGRRHARRRPPP